MCLNLNEIYKRYNTELKPLIAEQEIRMSKFEEPLLLNLSKMFDAFSIAQTGNGDMQGKLAEMNDILSICISQSYMYIAAAIKSDIKQFEKNNGGAIRLKLGRGIFYSKYENLKRQIRKIDKVCKKDENNFLSHFNDYKDSYLKCHELESLIEEVNDTETLLHQAKGSWGLAIIKYGLSIYISLWAGKYSSIYVKKLFEILKTMLFEQ